MTEISPAILTNDVSDFRKKYAELFALSHEFTKLHIDFMDDEFVKGRTLMPADLSFLKASLFTLIAHFMTFTPEKYFKDAQKFGFSYVLFHLEAVKEDHVQDVVNFGKHLGLKVGLVLNPETPLHKAGKWLTKVDMIQLMGIHPGAQGRQFMPEILGKVKELRQLTKNVILCIDGGVKVGVAKQLAHEGANILVAGSAIVLSPNPKAAIEELKKDIEA